MTADLKTVITDALDVDPDYFEGKNGTRTILFDQDNLDRLATAIRDHFLDREKVRAALIDALKSSTADYAATPTTVHEWVDDKINISAPYGWSDEGSFFDMTAMVDRLIAGLAGGSSE